MLLQILMPKLRAYWHLFTFVIILQGVSTAAMLYLPSVNANIIDKGIVTGDTGYIMREGAWMLTVSIVQVIATILSARFGAMAGMSIGRDLRHDVFHKVGTFSSHEVQLFGAPSLINRATNDVQQIQMLIVMSSFLLVSAPMMSIGGVLMALREDVGLSWIMAVSIPALIISIGVIVINIVPQMRLMQKRLDTINRVLREQLSGIRVIRAFIREDVEKARFGDANKQLMDVSLKAGYLQSLVFPTVMLVLNVSIVAVLWFGAYRVNSGEMQIGSLTAFLMYLLQILMSVTMATFIMIMIPRAAVCADRITEVFNTPSSVTPPLSPITEMSLQGEVEFRHVSMRYPGAETPVLSDVSFTVRAGKSTAIIGSTGSGKSTLISLIPRLLDTTRGCVLVNGVDVKDMSPELLHKSIGLVPQQSLLFSGTIASNLRFGRPEASDDELWAALDVAQASDFVSALEGKLDAAVNQGGTNFSGGQRQRLAIARALVPTPNVYLFDDSFSALDLTTEANLRSALSTYTKNAAVLVVAQRLSSIKTMDEIIVLENGKIVGKGTHEQLIRSCKTYIEIAESQAPLEVSL